MPNFVTESYDKLVERQARIDAFFEDLENQLTSIGSPATYHLDIYWDSGKIRRISDDVRIRDLSPADKLKYYNQGVGLMKLAINKTIYPE
jgi:hypothetical protein